MPFYAELSRARSTSSYRLVVAGVEPPEIISQYLSTHEVAVDDILTVKPGELEVSGTPALIITDSTGRVLRQWSGALSGREREVRNLLGL
jgi:hypothetical protein